MRSKNLFSILELMAVILVILLLITLITPTFFNLKMNARTALCKNNLRQIASLITSYQSDNNGYLPNDSKFDIPKPTIDLSFNNNLYRNWNGHLLPYMDVTLPDKYTRFAMVTKKGCTRFKPEQLGGPTNLPPTNVLTKGWVVIDDAYQVGGYQDLKSFICPEIHQNTFDVAAAIAYNGIKVPRISQLCEAGFSDTPGFAYGMAGGIPTTYLANNIFFGGNTGIWGPETDVETKSKRLDEIVNIAQKALFVEGGLCDAFGVGSNGAIGGVYYNIGIEPYDGGDLSSYSLQDDVAPSLHKLSFVHDNFDTFWIANKLNWTSDRDKTMEVISKFNAQFSGKAYIFAGINNPPYGLYCSLVSFEDPDKGKIFNSFFKANLINLTFNFKQYTDEPNDFKYKTGNMNVLFGDSSVATKDQAWLSKNRRQIAGLSQE